MVYQMPYCILFFCKYQYPKYIFYFMYFLFSQQPGNVSVLGGNYGKPPYTWQCETVHDYNQLNKYKGYGHKEKQ